MKESGNFNYIKLFCLGSPGFVIQPVVRSFASRSLLSHSFSQFSHAPKGASKMLRATGHARMVTGFVVKGNVERSRAARQNLLYIKFN